MCKKKTTGSEVVTLCWASSEPIPSSPKCSNGSPVTETDQLKPAM